jgi:hypothetical protein
MVIINEETKLLVEKILNKLFNVPFYILKVGPFISVLIDMETKAEF